MSSPKAVEQWMTTHFQAKCSNHCKITKEETSSISLLSRCTLKNWVPSEETSVLWGHLNKWKQSTCSEVTTERLGLLCLSFLILLDIPYGLSPGSSMTGEWEVPRTCLCFSHGNTHNAAISKQSDSYPYIC